MIDKKITIPIVIKKENINEDDNGKFKLRVSPELIKDVFEMYGVDLTNQNLLKIIHSDTFEISVKSY